MRRLWTALGLILVLTLLAFSAACSGKDDTLGASVSKPRDGDAASANERTPLELLTSAPAAVAEAKTMSIDGTMTMEGVPGYKSDGLTMTMRGQVDIEHNQAHLSMGGFGMQIETIQDGTVMYMKVAALGDKWMKIDYGSFLGDAGAQQLLGNGQSNPAATLESLRGVSGHIEEVGTETIRDVKTTHYHATVNVAKSLEEARKYLSEDAQKMLDDASATMAAEYPVDVWIDADNLVRRMSFTMTYGDAVPSLEGVTMTMTADYFDYGKPVSIEIPPADQVEDWSDAFPGLTP